MAELKTAFWRKAALSMPARTRSRYLADLQGAEQVELVLEGIVELASRVKSALHLPGGVRSAH